MITIKMTEQKHLFFIGARTNTDPKTVRLVYEKIFGGIYNRDTLDKVEEWLIEAHKQKKEIDNRNKMKIITKD